MSRTLCPLLLVLGGCCLWVALVQGSIRRPPSRRLPCPRCVKPHRNRGIMQQTQTMTTPTTPNPHHEQEEKENQGDESQLLIDFWRRINDIDEQRQFKTLLESNDYRKLRLNALGNDPHQKTTELTELRDDPTDEEKISKIEIPNPARCIPENTTVALKLDPYSSNIYVPDCTRVQRCGGCCSSDIFKCEPTEKVLRKFQVNVYGFKHGKFTGTWKSKIVQVEEHTKCTCGCRTKREHCNSLQKYDERACRCNCINNDDKFKCYAESNIKWWYDHECLCKCKEVSECSTGFYFDHQTCSCKIEPLDVINPSIKDREPDTTSKFNLHDRPLWELI